MSALQSSQDFSDATAQNAPVRNGRGLPLWWHEMLPVAIRQWMQLVGGGGKRRISFWTPLPAWPEGQILAFKNRGLAKLHFARIPDRETDWQTDWLLYSCALPGLSIPDPDASPWTQWTLVDASCSWTRKSLTGQGNCQFNFSLLFWICIPV